MTNTTLTQTQPTGSDVGSAEWMNLVKQQINPKMSDIELQFFAEVCTNTGLNPLSSPPQIYSVTRSGRMTIQTGIDGFRNIAARTGDYAGSDDPTFTKTENNTLESCTVSVYKMVQGQRCKFAATAYWAEYFPGERLGRMWLKMPHVMLSKCAEAQALRKAFPANLGGLYTNDEMAQAETMIAPEVTAEELETLVSLAIEAGHPQAVANNKAKLVRTKEQYNKSVLKLEQQIVDNQNTIGLEPTEGETNDDANN